MKRQLTMFAIGAVLSYAIPAFCADELSVEDRLKKVEGQLTQVLKENTDLRKELGYNGKTPPVVAKPAGKELKLAVGGFIQGQAEFGEFPDARYNGINDRFFLRRARLNLTGSFLENFDFKLEADFGANSISTRTNYTPSLTDAYFNWTRYSFASIRMGQFKSPYGYEQLVADTKLPTMERSLSNDRLTDGRQIGVALNGDVLKKRLSYSAAVFNGTSVNNSYNDNEKFMYAGRVSGVPVETQWGKQPVKWSVGVDGLITDDAYVLKPGFGFDSVPGGAIDNIFAGDRSAWGVDTQLKIGPFDLQAEFLQSRFEPTDGIPDAGFEARGLYILGGLYVIPNKIQALVGYDVYDPNTSVAGNTTQEWTFGLNYFIKGDDLKLSLNYLLGDQPGDGLGYRGRLLARMQIVF